MTFDVTDAIAGDGSVTFILNIVAGNDVWFSSSEGASGPELVIESSAIQVEVMDRQVFHNNSALDGNNPVANTNDDQAIASDKQALLGGETAGLDNFTSYSKGLNGIMIDIQNLPATSLSAADFIFRTGSDINPAGWATAPAPVSITVRPGDGVNGSHRVTLIWADNNQDGVADAHEAIANGWLQVTVLPTANTGLTSEDVFYFGNLPGDATGDGVTNAFDLLRVRQNYLMPPGDGRDNTADLTMDGNVKRF
ncbi:MAG: hypothetical protein HC898_04150 [Phycisphaerales bacterium]|nr:hypothetical protein [Phycisphaerales bacterium]